MNESSRRLDYEKISSLNIKLLSTLQNKLTLLLNEDSLTQSERKKSIDSAFVYQLINIQVDVIDKRHMLSQSKQKILKNLISMF